MTRSMEQAAKGYGFEVEEEHAVGVSLTTRESTAGGEIHHTYEMEPMRWFAGVAWKLHGGHYDEPEEWDEDTLGQFESMDEAMRFLVWWDVQEAKRQWAEYEAMCYEDECRYLDERIAMDAEDEASLVEDQRNAEEIRKYGALGVAGTGHEIGGDRGVRGL